MIIELLKAPKSINYEAINERWFKTNSAYTFKWEVFHKGGLDTFKCLVPAKYEWDGATIPRAFWSLIGLYPTGIMTSPSLLHDYIYVNKGILDPLNAKIRISRKHCDLLFYEHLKHAGLEEKKAKKIYKIVRLFGRFWWFDINSKSKL